MYTEDSESSFGFRAKKDGDRDTNLVSWLMGENEAAASPFSFPSSIDDRTARFSYETFPQQLPSFGGEYPSEYVPPAAPYADAVRQPVDSFGFLTELQLPTQEQMNVQDGLDPFQASTEHSSNQRSARPPSTAQVKNRKAQKKFRERQKAKMVNLSEEVETLRRRVENLSVENRDLENSNMLLNKVIKMRDRQMVILKARTESLMLENSSDGVNRKIPELLTCDEGSLSMERSLEVANHLTANFPASKFANISQASLRDIWKQYVDLLSGMLINHEADSDNPTVHEQIKVAVGELGEICMNCATLCPTSMCALVATGDTAFTLPVDSDEVQTFWKKVLTSLKLSPHQERLLLELRSRFLLHLENVWKKRTLLSNRLQTFVMSKEDVFKSNLYSCRSGSGVREVFQELQETCLTDGQYHTDFIASFFQLVLEDIQTARVFVESFPYYPDVLQISNLVYKKHQDEAQTEGPKSHASSNTSLHSTVSTSRV